MLSDEDIEYLYGRGSTSSVLRIAGATPTPRDNTDLSVVLSGPVESPRVTVPFYPGMMLAANTRAKLALDDLYQAIRQVSFGVQVTPGRLVLINNTFTLHSRDRFIPEDDDNGRAHRWVQRVFDPKNLSVAPASAHYATA
ncbi:TauD/TfdA family dioxygenase [Paraburkholderia lacunae]|uniref:TauD/TfdA family dioxygenase n=1 Tax=Paraburkholderia lacunae TaxID=2211104 RepID=UPI001FCB9896|nr:TauD/TfdA family dioxygenase [Paraburkholderia lacunae]